MRKEDKESKDSKKRSNYKSKGKGNKRNSKPKRSDSGRAKYVDKSTEGEITTGMIPMKDGERNPNWYFTDRAMADQVTQLAFQNLAGYPINVNSLNYDVPNIATIFLNPCPGTIKSADYGSALLNKTAGVNLAGFKLFSELAAYTGRSAIYGPQDISTMILGLGEIISMTEVIRRMFGVAFTMNMRNRSYPRTVLECMYVDPDDLFANYSNYRTQFNTLITMINQIPIPASIAYFDKCLRIYQEIYLDTDSAMAQTLIPMPWTTWVMDETSYSGGTILKSIPVTCQPGMTLKLTTVQPMSYYLNILDTLIGAMLNSSTLNVVYTDLLNLATKKSVSFLRMDYLSEGYAVMPRYSEEFSLQMHNATLTGVPQMTALISTPMNVTPYNDVYPNASTNSLYYNPGFMMYPDGTSKTGSSVLVDLKTDSPDVVDRIESLRFTSIAAQNIFTYNNYPWACDASMPDHYVVCTHFWTPRNGISNADWFRGTIVPDTTWKRLSSLVANIDWAPRFYEIDETGNTGLTGNYTGDINFYTTVDQQWIDKVNKFIALSLYTMR